ncbi:hypothetical protein TRAPUB_5706 [Trametes pubescens]|uniref:Uncharacterized protein n=1 Tax=Trametes pubescens TaxID=154538 RepID=A0A1M2V7U9_TRAPU|nr:hypothetical protein TRAPUB_5706 [Trametes pubescens]
MPYPSSRPVGAGDVPTPIPIHNPVPSPMHPALDIPPDGWVPYENADGEIPLPPPHELSRPVTPRSVSPAPPPEAQAPAPPPRDYLYANTNASQSGPIGGGRPTPNIYRPFSPQSKASTSISQFDLVAPRVKSRGAKAREDRDRVPTSPRGPRPRENLPPLRPVMEERQDTAGTSGSGERGKSPTTPLDAEFKKRYRRGPTRGPSHESVIPDIRVEAPSTPSTSRSSTKTQITHPHLLSPETNPRPLTPSQDADVIVMRTEIPGYYPMVPPGSYKPPYQPPYPEDDDESPVIPPRIVPEGPFPPGFVPITPPMPTSSLDHALPIPSNNPLPIPSNNPLPIPQRSPHPVSQRNPLPTPQSNPLPIRPPSAGPLPVPQRNPLPVPDKGPVPIPHRGPIPIPTRDEPLPVPHRSGTPSRRYVEADMPPGVVYPSPPSRRSRTPSSSVTSPPGSRRTLRDMRSPAERLSPLPLQFFQTMRSDTNTE